MHVLKHLLGGAGLDGVADRLGVDALKHLARFRVYHLLNPIRFDHLPAIGNRRKGLHHFHHVDRNPLPKGGVGLLQGSFEVGIAGLFTAHPIDPNLFEHAKALEVGHPSRRAHILFNVGKHDVTGPIKSFLVRNAAPTRRYPVSYPAAANIPDPRVIRGIGIKVARINRRCQGQHFHR